MNKNISLKESIAVLIVLLAQVNSFFMAGPFHLK